MLGVVVKRGEISRVVGVDLCRMMIRGHLAQILRRFVYRNYWLLCSTCFPLCLSP